MATNAAPVVNGLSGNISSRLAIQPIVSSQRFGVASGVPSFGDATSTARPSLKRRERSPNCLAALHEIPEDETAAGVRDDVEGRRLLRQPFEQHPGVLLRRSAEAEMVERENAIGVRVLHAIEEIGIGQVAIRGRGVRKRSVDEQERAIR